MILFGFLIHSSLTAYQMSVLVTSGGRWAVGSIMPLCVLPAIISASINGLARVLMVSPIVIEVSANLEGPATMGGRKCG